MARSVRDSLSVRLGEIKDAGERFDIVLKDAEVAELLGDIADEFRPGHDLSADFDLNRVGEIVSVNGKAKVDLVFTCCRCLTENKIVRQVGLKWTCLPEKKYQNKVSGLEEIELTSDDLDVSFYKGEVIDVGDILRQAIILELEPFPVCESECTEGLVGSVKDSESLIEDDIDPRWLPLLKAKKSN